MVCSLLSTCKIFRSIICNTAARLASKMVGCLNIAFIVELPCVVSCSRAQEVFSLFPCVDFANIQNTFILAHIRRIRDGEHYHIFNIKRE